MTIHLYGGLAEWSKAADLRSVGRLSARVRTSHPSITYFFPQSLMLDIFFFLCLPFPSNVFFFFNKQLVLKPLKERLITYLVLYEVFEIQEKNTIQVIFPKELQTDPPAHQSLMVLKPLSLRYTQ